MKKKHMPQDVFEYGVCVVAKGVLSGQYTSSEMADVIWRGYKSDILDDGVKDDLILAAEESIEWLKNNNAPAIGEFFHHFQWYCYNFDESGKPRKKKLLNGLWFSKPIQDPNRVANFRSKLQGYYFLAKAGLAKLAPDDWDPTK